jgi:hypothetical protein
MRFEYQVTFLDDDDNVPSGYELGNLNWQYRSLIVCDFGKRSTLNRFPQETVNKHIYHKAFITKRFSTGPAALVHEVTRKKVLGNGNSLVVFSAFYVTNQNNRFDIYAAISARNGHFVNLQR